MSKLNTAGKITVLSTYPKSTIQAVADMCRRSNGMFVKTVPILTTGIPHLIAEKKRSKTMLTSKQSAGGNLTRTDRIFNQQRSCLPG